MAIQTIMTQEMIDEYTFNGYWGPMNLAHYLDQHAAYTPENEALVDCKTRVTYGQMKIITDRIALKFLEMGIRPEDRIGIQTPNWVEYFYLRFACAKIGAVAVPFIYNVRDRDIEWVLKETEAVAFAFCADFHDFDYIQMAEKIRPNLPNLKHLIAIGERTGKGMINLKDLMEDEIEARHPPGYLSKFYPDPNSVDILMQTSGSTARPKIVLRTHNIFNSLGKHIVTKAKMTAEEVVLAAAPVNQGTGYSVAVVADFIIGCKTVLLERFVPEEALKLIEQEKVTMAVGVPAMMIKMMNSASFKDSNMKTLRLFYHAGAPLPPDAAEAFAKQFGCQLMEAYGALDGGTPVHTSLDDPPEKIYGTVGRVCPGFVLRTIDNDGKELPSGEVGEVVYKGPNCAVGLYNNPDHSYDENGWFLTGDLGVIDEQGYLRIVGRKKEIIIRGGSNISPQEVEEELISHPKIVNVSVVKMPDPVLGERACAFVIPKEKEVLSLDEMTQFLEKKNVAKYKWPERLELVPEFPLLPNGKIDKRALEGEIAQMLRVEGKIA